MPLFSYQAVTATGQDASGQLEAASRGEAISIIRNRGLQPLSLEERTTSTRPKKVNAKVVSDAVEPPRPRRRRVSRRELPAFTRQLGTLLKAGIPMSQALSIVSEQSESEGMSELTLRLHESISEGASLSEAMAEHPRLFNRLYVNMVRVGEEGGVLDAVLTQLTSFLEAERELRSSLTTALVYPLVVLSLGFVSVMVLTFFVIPGLSDLFADFNAQLPLLTRIVIGGSAFLVKWWWAVFIATGGAVWGVRKILKNAEVIERIDAYLLRAPLLGPLLTKAHIARFARTMGTLVNAGIPVLTAVQLVAETTGSPVMGHALRSAAERIGKGEGVAEPLRQEGLFPPMVTNMISVGEQSGSLDDMLLQVAGAYDVELQQALKRFITILEPLLILLLAVVVGTIIAAFLFPILSLSEVLS